MSLTVRECLKLPSLRNCDVVAGKNGLNRIVNNVSVLEVFDTNLFGIEQTEKNGCLLLTSFDGVKENYKAQCRQIENMYNVGDAALIIYYVGIYLKEIHPSLIETADRLGIPIIVMPQNSMTCFYNEVIREVYEEMFRQRTNNTGLIRNITSTVSHLPENKKTLSNLMEMICRQLNVTLLLSDLYFNKVCLGKYPKDNCITATEICDLYEAADKNNSYMVDIATEHDSLHIFRVPFSTFEHRNFFIYVVDENRKLILDDVYHIIEVLQIFSKLWDMDTDNILENSLVPAIIEGDSEKAKRISAQMGINLSAINTTMIIRPKFVDETKEEQLKIKREAVSAIKEFACDIHREIIVDTFGEYIICFVIYSPSAEDDNHSLNELIRTLDQTLPKYTITILPCEKNIEDVKKSYNLYTEYISDVTTVFPNKKQLSYGDFFFIEECRRIIAEKNDRFRILSNILNSLNYCKDKKELLDTLAVHFLDANREMKTTAKLLYVHRNTVQYRLNKASTLTNFSITDMLEAYLMSTALACWRIITKH